MKQFESGRSMVEMLGVLAIIGVLSIGAMSSYKYAMDKSIANEALNNTNMIGTVLSTSVEAGGQENVVLDPLLEKTAGGVEFSLKDYDELKNAYIKVDFKDKTGACKKYVEMFNKTGYKIIGACKD